MFHFVSDEPRKEKHRKINIFLRYFWTSLKNTGVPWIGDVTGYVWNNFLNILLRKKAL